MVVNVDHLCPFCKGDGKFCGICNTTGVLRAPGGTVMPEPELDIKVARQSLKDFREGRWQYAKDVVKELRDEAKRSPND